jgi:hypothetical protein
MPETEYQELFEDFMQPEPVAHNFSVKKEDNASLHSGEPPAEMLLLSEDEEEFQVMAADIETARQSREFSEEEPVRSFKGEDIKESAAEGEASSWEEMMEQVPGVFGAGETTSPVSDYQVFAEEPVEEDPEEPNAVCEEGQNEELATCAPEPAPEEAEHSCEPELEPVAAIDITIEELMEAYQQNDETADERYNDKLLALTGVVALANVRGDRDFQYVTVTGKDQNIFRSIKCVFNMDKAFQLEGLERGQTVVISGRFRGSLTSMSLVDCSIIELLRMILGSSMIKTAPLPGLFSALIFPPCSVIIP